MKSLNFLLLSLISLSIVISCNNEKQLEENQILKKPTEITANSDEAGNKNKRELYFNLIHGNDSSVDWKQINQDNFRAKSFARNHSPKAYYAYANNQLEGEWRERGSSNQAGNLKIADFDPLSNTIYAISDGGILWKSDLNGTNWTSLNDGFVLDKRVLKTIRKPNGGLRILAAIGYTLWYSDDEGATWNTCGNFNSSVTNGSAIDLVQLNDQDSTLVYLYSKVNAFGNGNNTIAVSTDHGTSFQEIHTFSSNNSRVASMSSPYQSSVAYLIDKNQEILKFENGNLTPLSSNFNYSGTDFYQLESVITPTDTTFYILTDKSNLYQSTDELSTIQSIGTLPVDSWECGIGVSTSDPSKVYFGEVELHYSDDGGNNWNLVNTWQAYYGDVLNNIHADIMSIQSFEKTDGTEFTLIPNHGGLNISYDHLQSTQNISLSGLNIGQFYDVSTSPINPAVILGGTQDQGFQRTGSGIGNNAVAFVQIISGDYGQQQFTNSGQSIWTQYPGGQFSYYQNAMTDNGAQFWHDINGNDMPNYDWIIPSGSAPNLSDDYILVGGGNINGGDGSYLIKMWDNFASASTSQFPFDFKAASGAEISAIETTPLDDQKWYVSTANGFFYHSEDAGQSWTQSAPFGGPTANWIYGADIYASRTTPGLVYFGGSGYSNSPAFVSTDGGQSFTAINNGLPPTMIHEMCMDPNENFLFAATDAGPYVYSVDQNEWFDLLGNDAPIQEYITCEYVQGEDIVRFGTWGRGIWDFHILDASYTNELSKDNEQISVYPIPSRTKVITVETPNNSKCGIYNINGKKVFEVLLIKGKNKLNLTFLPSGTYILKGQSNSIHKKFVL